MTYPPYPQQPGGGGYQHPENDHGGYANPQYQQQQYSGMPDPGGTANGTGKLDFGGAISFGFKAVFQQPGFWIGMTLLMWVLITLIGIIVAIITPGSVYDVSNPDAAPTVGSTLQKNIPSVIGGVLSVFGINAGLKYIDKGSVSVSEAFQNPQFGVVFAIQIVAGLLGLGLSLGALSSPVFLRASVVISIGSFFLAPFLMFLYPSLLDGRGSVTECLSLSIDYGRRNYLILLGFSVVMGLILVAGFLPCGLGLIVVMPALFLMQANAYRQISGGLVRSL
jgi:putative membrane protein